MNVSEILQTKNIDPNKPVLMVSRSVALESLMEAVEKYCPKVNIEEMSKEDLETLIDSLGENIIMYHPENYHQERGALLGNIDILRRCGLTDEEERAIDFC